MSGPGLEQFSGPVPCVFGFCIESAPGAPQLWAVAGTSTQHLWAVGDGALLRFDGSRWDTACGSLAGWMLQTAYAAGDRDAWIGGRGSIAHYDGAWTSARVDQGWNVFELWGSGREAFATFTGVESGIARWDGAAWSPSYQGPYASNLRVWGNGTGRAWGVDGGNLIEWNGASWTTPARPHNLLDVWAPEGGEPWFAGYTFRDPEWWVHDAAVSTLSGDTYSARPLPLGYSEARWIRGSGPLDVWVGATTAERAGAVDTWRWDGSTWQRVPAPSPTHWAAPLVLSPSEAWLAESAFDGAALRDVARIRRFDGVRWSESLALDAPWISAVVTTASGAVFAAGDDGLWRYDGARWNRLHGPLGFRPLLAADGEEVWAVGRDASSAAAVVVHWDGSRVADDRLARAATALHARGGHAWVATEGSTAEGITAVIQQWNGTAWTSLDTGTTMLVSDIWASGPSDVWAVGAIYPTTWTSQTGVVAHWDGMAWARREFRDYGFRTVWGTGPRDVWLSGDTEFCQKCPPVAPAPLLLRWDGTRLTEAAALVLDEITGAGASGPLTALASTWNTATADRTATIYRFDGNRWFATARLDVPFRPYGLHVAGDGTIWGADAGRIVRRRVP